MSGQSQRLSPDLPTYIDLEEKLGLAAGSIGYTEAGDASFECVKKALGD